MAAFGALEIRTVFIADDRRHFDAPHVQKLLEFFAGQEGMSAKIVLTDDWDSCMVDHGIPACVDFGIYGESLLFTGDTYTPVDISSWSKSPADIKRFTRFFDSIWNARTVSASYAGTTTQKVTLSQLMKADSSVDRRQSENAVHETVARIEERIRPEVA